MLLYIAFAIGGIIIWILIGLLDTNKNDRIEKSGYDQNTVEHCGSCQIISMTIGLIFSLVLSLCLDFSEDNILILLVIDAIVTRVAYAILLGRKL